MQFVAKEDIDAPIEELFAALSDFEGLERSAIRRGVEVQRKGDITAPAPGLAWDTEFTFRSAQRKIAVELVAFEPSTDMAFTGEGNGISSEMQVELISLSPRRTRLTVTLKLKPKTLAGRLMVQSLKLVRGKVARRFKSRVSEFAKMAVEKNTQVA